MLFLLSVLLFLASAQHRLTGPDRNWLRDQGFKGASNAFYYPSAAARPHVHIAVSGGEVTYIGLTNGGSHGAIYDFYKTNRIGQPGRVNTNPPANPNIMHYEEECDKAIACLRQFGFEALAQTAAEVLTRQVMTQQGVLSDLSKTDSDLKMFTKGVYRDKSAYCPAPYQVVNDRADCKEALERLGLAAEDLDETHSMYPRGCYSDYYNNGFFNVCNTADVGGDCPDVGEINWNYTTTNQKPICWRQNQSTVLAAGSGHGWASGAGWASGEGWSSGDLLAAGSGHGWASGKGWSSGDGVDLRSQEAPAVAAF